jgi:hypothetical protein
MSAAPKRVCPVCRRPVTRTRRGNIAGHFDNIGHPCPASYELGHTHAIPPGKQLVRRRRTA